MSDTVLRSCVEALNSNGSWKTLSISGPRPIRAGSLGRVEQFLHDLHDWASGQSDIKAVALVGSHARKGATEDSDVDLVIVATQPDVYLRNTAWAQRFGTIKRQQVEDYGKVTSVRVWYDEGLEVEYGLTDETWAALPLDEGSREVISGGMRVLCERGDTLSRHSTDDVTGKNLSRQT